VTAEECSKLVLMLVQYSILASQNNLKQLEARVKIGLNNGLTDIEIREAMMHVIGYCGSQRVWMRKFIRRYMVTTADYGRLKVGEKALNEWKEANPEGDDGKPNTESRKRFLLYYR